MNVDPQGNIQYGVVRGGDTQVVNRLIAPEALPPFAVLPLQDAVDYATFLVRASAEAMRFEPNVAPVGGPIDVLAITLDGMRWVRRKELRA